MTLSKLDIVSYKDTRNCPEKAMKISHFNPNQSAPSIYIMIELCYFSLDQWEIRIHLLWGKSFNIPLHCDPHLNQTKWLIFNDLLPLTIPGVLTYDYIHIPAEIWYNGYVTNWTNPQQMKFWLLSQNNSFLRQQLLVGLDFASLRFCEQVWTMVLRPS